MMTALNYAVLRKAVSLSFLVSFSIMCFSGVAAANRLLGGEVGVRVVNTLRCGDNDVRSVKRSVQVIVVGDCGSCKCGEAITEKLLNMSDLRAGYVCISAGLAKMVTLVSPEDSKVTNQRRYRQNLLAAQSYAEKKGLKVDVFYISMKGSTVRQPRCKYDYF